MEQVVDKKLGDAHDVIELTQERYMKRVGKINWGDHQSRMTFFRELAQNIADNAEFFRRPFNYRPVHTQARIMDDLNHIMRFHGKKEFEKALKKLQYDRVPDNGEPQTAGHRHSRASTGDSCVEV